MYFSFASFLALVAVSTAQRVSFANVPFRYWLTKGGDGCIVLNCTVVGGPGWSIRYTVNSVPLNTDANPDITPLASGSLEICNVDPARHSGTYRCDVSTDTFRSYRQISVRPADINRLRYFVRIQEFKLALPGQSATNCAVFTCTAHGLPSPVTYRFTRNNVPVDLLSYDVLGNTFRYCGGDLPAGNYSCIATNGARNRDTRFLSWPASTTPKAAAPTPGARTLPGPSPCEDVRRQIGTWTARRESVETSLATTARETARLRLQLTSLQEQLRTSQTLQVQSQLDKLQEDASVTLAGLADCNQKMGGVRSLIKPCT